jgi:hypothetical protein
MRLWQRLLGGLSVLAATAVFAPAALATSTASMSLDQSAGTSAGAGHNLGLDLSFTDTGTDSPKDLTINLPPGLLANAAVDDGTCLTTAASTSPTAACEVGSGTVNAEADLPVGLLGVTIPVPVSVPVSFYLVKPPSSSDLAGLEVYSSEFSEQLGSTGPIIIRPSGSADGVGATIELTLPDTLDVSSGGVEYPLAQVSITSIDSTFDGLRYPTTCPSSPAPLTATVDSYAVATLQTLSRPLSVTGCSSLSFNPAFSATAKRDSADKVVTLTTSVTETASEAPSQSVALSFPTTVVGPNLASLANLCVDFSAGCPVVGSVTAQSPLYPTALTGKAYFTGNGSGLTLTLVFPAPFPLTLVGAIHLISNSATFTGLPDIPLTSLAVTLNGGPKGLFDTDCVTPSGTATAKLVDQNGDKTATVPDKFTVSGCPASSGTGTGSGSGSSSGSGSGSGATSAGPTATAGGTDLDGREVSGLAKGKPSLRFTVSVVKKASKIGRLTVKLPSGLRFRSHTSHHVSKVTGIKLKGAKARSATLSHGRLVLTFRRTERKVTVTLGPRSLEESQALRAKAEKKRLKKLKLEVTVRNARHHSRALTVTIGKQHLS